MGTLIKKSKVWSKLPKMGGLEPPSPSPGVVPVEFLLTALGVHTFQPSVQTDSATE